MFFCLFWIQYEKSPSPYRRNRAKIHRSRPEDFQSEASAVSGSGISSGVTDGTGSYGLDVAGRLSERVTRKHHDFQLVSSQKRTP